MGRKSLSAYRTLDVLKVDAPHLGRRDHAPHLGHTASSEARTFSRLIFRALGMICFSGGAKDLGRKNTLAFDNVPAKVFLT